MAGALRGGAARLGRTRPAHARGPISWRSAKPVATRRQRGATHSSRRTGEPGCERSGHIRRTGSVWVTPGGSLWAAIGTGAPGAQSASARPGSRRRAPTAELRKWCPRCEGAGRVRRPHPARLMEDWWGDVEREVLQCLEGRQAVPVGDVARRLGISELAAASLLALLAGGGGSGSAPSRPPTPVDRRPEGAVAKPGSSASPLTRRWTRWRRSGRPVAGSRSGPQCSSTSCAGPSGCHRWRGERAAGDGARCTCTRKMAQQPHCDRRRRRPPWSRR